MPFFAIIRQKMNKRLAFGRFLILIEVHIKESFKFQLSN